ncbi:MAG: hydrogen peroxide-inducible genes activator [Pseudomonadales bacterium]
MTLTELRYIVTLAKTQHFGRAAQACFVSQPTLSIAVKKLEEELNVAVFERTKNTVRPTDVGLKIIEQAKVVLQQSETIKELAMADADQLATPLKVGAIYTIGPYLFPKLVHQMRGLAPQMPLYIEENYTHKLREKLLNAELDAIVVALPFSEPDVVTRPLYDEEFLMLMEASHPWSERTCIAAQDLAQTELLLLGEGHCFRDQILNACSSLQQAMNTQHKATEGSSIETIRMMVASGLGSSVIPKSAVYAHTDMPMLVARPFSEPKPGRTVALAWRASFPRSKAIDCLVDALQHCTPQE